MKARLEACGGLAMLTRVRNFIKVLVVVSLVFWLAGSWGQTAVSADEGQQVTRLISVSGTAELTARPDLAKITFGVQTEAKTAREAVQSNANLMRSVMNALHSMGITDENIETGSYSVYSYYPPEVKEVIIEEGGSTRRETTKGSSSEPTYRANNTITITVTRLDKVGEIIDAVVAAGANQVQGISFGLKNQDELVLKGLAQAVEQARRKADAIAKAAGVTILRVRSISEESAYYVPYRAQYQLEGMGGAKAADPTPIVPGDVNVFARVRAEFEMQ